MHWRSHPVDLATQLFTKHGVSYDSASASATKAALGDDLAVVLRYTDPEKSIQDVFEPMFGWFGFAVRTAASDGDREFFTFRQKGDSAPTLRIDSNVLRW